MDYELSVPCLFGLEGLAADELRRLKMENVRAENGRVLFSGNKEDIARANINLRTGERVLLVVGHCNAESFNELFEGVKNMPWEHYIPVDGAFPVKGHSLNSQLHSIPDCQSIVKKAVVERLKMKFKAQWFKETGAKYQIQFAIMNDVAWLYIDTSGAGLHKRGYRPVGNAAPLRETLAAAMVSVARYRGREAVYDPFCGSGTIPIEAALAAMNRAPGLNRRFAADKWIWLKKDLWDTAREEARDREFNGKYEIFGGDIDPECIEIATANAKRAGVEQHITFEVADARSFEHKGPGIIISNPPYGERVMEHREAERLYNQFGKVVKELKDMKMYILSSHTEFERTFGRTADKKRKLYNGMIKCDLYMYNIK
ncbi:MAG: class I SAM-dependent RNA methyltransferase [Ruminococcaceae bacterium]|nr:class I SAM-dependent RNA methyltransferase [Oscillospiraceae bacterium]